MHLIKTNVQREKMEGGHEKGEGSFIYNHQISDEVIHHCFVVTQSSPLRLN